MDEFERSTESLRRQRARMGQDHAEMKKEIGRDQDRGAAVLLAGCGLVLLASAGLVLFGCWCLYHVLKAKKLVP